MTDTSSFMINLSVLYRNTQKYYDRVLTDYNLGSGQLMYLLFINENEGAAMQEVTRLGEMDKSTTSSAINRLADQGYIRIVVDDKDHRVKRLYCTEKAAGVMTAIYELRNHCRESLAQGMDFKAFEDMLARAADNSRRGLQPEADFASLKIGGMQKMTLLDYPGKVAATIFTAGCNFKCPFCHNRDLVFIPENYEYFDPDDVLSYLKKRKGLLDGVCVSGGEPLKQKDIISFIEKIKTIGYAVKLDTNGYYPERLKDIVEAGLVDYVAMDIKNVPDKYAETLGMSADAFSYKPISESIAYLSEGHVEYEFRTTVIREFHEAADLEEIAASIKGAKHYYLQQFVDSGHLIQENTFHAYNRREMEVMLEKVKNYVSGAELRGVREE